uniref:Serine/threonine-protein phosphatase n=1 Tax=Meloidogyne enterolobii TaxID=390850 RepID=A0A6V7XI30_MELEN|nr:unnamed protein product [Meloidogyne enterolobii]
MDVDGLLNHLMCTRDIVGVNPAVINKIINQALKVFASQPVMLELNPPITICGDIHGQYNDLIEMFNKIGQPGKQLPSTKYLFLGDYVDRGSKSIETIILLFCYKIKFPKNFYLLRGNHETSSINAVYGFKKEISKKFGNSYEKLWDTFNNAFAQMPITALVGGEKLLFFRYNFNSFTGRILCMHGGISQHLGLLRDLKKLKRGWKDPKDSGPLATDLLWADPDAKDKGWRPSPRGISFTFGNDVL